VSLRRKIGWAVVGLAVFLLVAGFAGYLYLKSKSFEQFALRKLSEQVTASTGAKAEVETLDFNLSTLTVRLHNITLRGTEALGQPPLLHADELTVGLKIVSVLHQQVSLRELIVERPIVHVQVNRSGESNLPQPPLSKSSSQTSPFDLAVGYVQIADGEVDYKDQKVPLDASLYNLSTDIHFVPLSKRYEGTLSYSSGEVRYSEYAPLPHSLKVAFSASPERFSVASAEFRVGSSAMTLRADLSNYANPQVDGNYQIRIHTQDAAQIVPDTAPAGDLLLEGGLHYRTGSEGQSILQGISIDGRLLSEALAARSAGRRVELHRIRANYQLAHANLQVRDFSAEVLGGAVGANVGITSLDRNPEYRVQASLKNLALQDLQRAFHQQDLAGTALVGKLNGDITAGWKGNISNLRARSDLTVQAVASRTTNSGTGELPLNGVIHASYDGSRQSLVLEKTSLKTPSASLTADGEISNHSNLRAQCTAADLHQIAALVASFSQSQITPPAISGSAVLDAVVRGSMKKPVISATLNARELGFQGTEWTSAKIDVQADPSSVVIRSASLVNTRRGQASLSGDVSLRNWTYQQSGPIKANLSLQQLALSDLLRMANQQYPVSGDISGKIALEGSAQQPVLSGGLQLANGRIYDEPIRALTLAFQTASGSLTSKLNVVTSAGSADATLSYAPASKAYKIQFNAPGLNLQKLQVLQAKGLPVSGTISASAEGQGSIDDPGLHAVVQCPELQIQQKPISGMKAELNVANHSATLDFESKISEALVKAHGRVALNDGYDTEASIDTGTIPLEVLLATYAKGVPEGFAGQAQLHVSLKGPLKEKSQLEAHVSIPVFRASYQSLELGISTPIRVDYKDSVTTLQPAEIQGTGTTLHVQGRIPVGGKEAPTLSAQGSIDMRILRMVSSDLQSSGVVALDLHSSGSAENPVVQGQLQLKDVAMTESDSPVGVDKLNGTINVTNNRLEVSKVTGQVGGGRVSLGGVIDYRPKLQFNLALQGKGIRLRYPEGLRSSLDTDLTFTGDAQSSKIGGRITIASLSFTPDFDLAKFSDQFTNGTATPSQPGFADTVKLGIAVQTRESLSANSSQISIAGQAALQVGGTAADPVITGRTNLTSGELFYRNVRYQLERGVITFDNPNETHPVLNVSVTTIVNQYNLTLGVRGPLDKLTTSYVSDPPLATADIINLIARGKTTQESNAASQSTDSMIASQALSQVSGSVQKLAGISSLQIDPMIGGNNQNPSARVAIQQRVTKSLLFSFSTDVSQPGSEIVQGEYQFNKRWSVSMARDQLGGISVDGRYHTRF